MLSFYKYIRGSTVPFLQNTRKLEQSIQSLVESFGVRHFARFISVIVNGNFKFLYIFGDGSYLKKKGKLYYRKVKKYGSPCIIFPASNLVYIPEVERRISIAEDINQDLIWIQKSNLKSL